MQRCNIWKKTIFWLLLIILSICTPIGLGLRTELGAKLIAAWMIHLTKDTLELKLENLHGNLFQGINCKNLTYVYQEHKLNLTNFDLKLNWLDLISKQQLTIKLYNVLGSFAGAPIAANFDLSKNCNQLVINNDSFIKIGQNSLLIPKTTLTDLAIKFSLNLEQLELLVHELTGKLEVKGELAKDLSTLQADLKIIKLLFAGTDYTGFFQGKNSYGKFTYQLLPQPNIKFSFALTDLSHIVKLTPEISRAKGIVTGSLMLNNFFDNLELTTAIKFSKLSITLPKYGIKIKPLNIELISEEKQAIILQGQGFIRDHQGSFSLFGKFDPFNFQSKHYLTITGKDLEAVTPEYNLTTNLDLTLNFELAKKLINIKGNSTIWSGTIRLIDKEFKVVRSNDVRIYPDLTNVSELQNNKPPADLPDWQIIPDLDLRIEPNTKLIGKGLDANISGKLKIYTSEDHKAVLGEGRFSIKHGIYKLSGQELFIEKGRLIYLPGTLITNPLLDIKISSNQHHAHGKEKYIYIEGTIDQPKIRDGGLIDESQAVLQLLNFANSKFTQGIKEKFDLYELGIQEDERPQLLKYISGTEPSLLDRKNFVVGKKLAEKVELKYLKTLNNMQNTFRLKYILNKNFALELESNTEEGYGANIKFSKEK